MLRCLFADFGRRKTANIEAHQIREAIGQWILTRRGKALKAASRSYSKSVISSCNSDKADAEKNCNVAICARKLNTDSFEGRGSIRGGVRKMAELTMLIDCDAGPDDAWAIFLALAARNEGSNPFQIVAITCTQGNTSVDNVTVNVTRSLQAVNETSIPVYRGAESSVVLKYDLGDDPWAGQDGFGDAGFPPLQPVVEPGNAVDTIIAMAEQYRGNLTIVALGPLTNIALAVRVRPDIKNMIKQIYILGGNINATGNDTLVAEFNFSVDPEAAHIVLEEFSQACPMFIIPWETALAASPSLDFRLNTLGTLGTPQVELLNRAEAKVLENATDIWTSADALVMALVIAPEVVLKSQDYYCTVELSGKYSRGLMVVDKDVSSSNIKNCTIIQEVDQAKWEQMLISTAGGVLDKRVKLRKSGGKRRPLATSSTRESKRRLEMKS